MKYNPIETKYNGYLFRSRLEARWAIYFDTLGIHYEYEKEGYDLGEAGWYLPDFWLPQVQMWAEVKGSKFTEEESEKAKKLVFITGYPVLRLVGLPDYKTYLSWEINPSKNIAGNSIQECDYLVSAFHGYVFSENRFYSNTECKGMSEKQMKAYVLEHLRESMQEGIEAARSARFEYGDTGYKIERKPLTMYETFKYKFLMRSNGYTMREIHESLKTCFPYQIRYQMMTIPYKPDIKVSEKKFNEEYIRCGYVYDCFPSDFHHVFSLEECSFLLGDVSDEVMEIDELRKKRTESKNKKYPFEYYLFNCVDE